MHAQRPTPAATFAFSRMPAFCCSWRMASSLQGPAARRKGPRSAWEKHCWAGRVQSQAGGPALSSCLRRVQHLRLLYQAAESTCK